MTRRIRRETRKLISRIYRSLDYVALGTVYCDEGGDAFWKAKRGTCERLGVAFANVLKSQLKPGGCSLYAGAGVWEIPMLAMETLDLDRRVVACNLRRREVAILNRACGTLPFRFAAADAGSTTGRFDHLCILSVLNDPERFPQLSALSYGRANPVMFQPARFLAERRQVWALADRCLRKLTLPAVVTTTTEEVVWIAEWCHRQGIRYRIDNWAYPTALVGDPMCVVLLGP